MWPKAGRGWPEVGRGSRGARGEWPLGWRTAPQRSPSAPLRHHPLGGRLPATHVPPPGPVASLRDPPPPQGAEGRGDLPRAPRASGADAARRMLGPRFLVRTAVLLRCRRASRSSQRHRLLRDWTVCISAVPDSAPRLTDETSVRPPLQSLWRRPSRPAEGSTQGGAHPPGRAIGEGAAPPGRGCAGEEARPPSCHTPDGGPDPGLRGGEGRPALRPMGAGEEGPSPGLCGGEGRPVRPAGGWRGCGVFRTNRNRATGEAEPSP